MSGPPGNSNQPSEQDLAQQAANAANNATSSSGSSFLQGSAQGAGITEAPPSAASSAYEYQTYVAGANITIGSQLAGILGLPANSTVNGDTVIRQFESLPYQELYQLETWLYEAGYYNNVEGQAPTTRPTFGVLDINAFAAMSQAILQTQNSGVSMSQLIANNVAQGVGKAGIQSQIQPITAGGNTYQISLPNPDDVRQTAFTVFQQELGRNPTQAELSALTASLDAQTSAYQSSINNQQEQMSQVKYQAELTSRQKELNAAVLPQVPTSAAPGLSPAPPGGTTTPGQSMVGMRTVDNQGMPSSQTATQEDVAKMAQAITAKSLPQNQPPAVQRFLAAVAAADKEAATLAKDPQVAAYFNALNEQKANQFSAPGDTYTPSNTLTTTQAPTAQGAAFTAATTGANAVPFGAENYLNAFNALQQLINSPVKA